MTAANQSPAARRQELACDRALSGLTPAEEAELAALQPHGVDMSFELAAAAIALAEVSDAEPLPRSLAERVLASSPAGQPLSMGGGTIPMMAALPRPNSAPVASSGPVVTGAPQSPTIVMRPQLRLVPGLPGPQTPANNDSGQPAAATSPAAARRSRIATWAPWLAAAACLVLAIGSIASGGWPLKGGSVAALAAASPAEQRARLLAEAPDTVKLAWSATADPAGQGESGDIVWSSARQQGYMTFRTLASNDPAKTQYQLWIFDGTRDERYPVDGGVFDVDASRGEVVIPITARVKVAAPKLFAVTVEAPGGVVVSKRERIVVTAQTAG